MTGDLHVLAEGLPGVIALVVVATAVLWGFGVPHRFAPAAAIARGAAQLALVSVVLSGVISDPRWVAVVLVVMFVAATWTASRRIGRDRATIGFVAAAMLLGAGVALTIVFATGAVELSPRYALALGGIVIGNAMTVASLAGRRFLEIVDSRWEEVEGWLALGATPRQSTADLTRAAVHAALIPATDQTRTTGLVTLPGAFVGAIFGGLSPLEAGRFQIVVLAAIMAAASLTAVVVVSGLGPVRFRPVVPS